MTFARNGMIYAENSLCLVTFECTGLAVLQALLLHFHFSNFFVGTSPSFIKWLPMRSCIFLFLLNTIVGLLTNTLWNSGITCRMCQYFLRTFDMFGSVFRLFFFACLFVYFFCLFCQLDNNTSYINNLHILILC